MRVFGEPAAVCLGCMFWTVRVLEKDRWWPCRSSDLWLVVLEGSLFGNASVVCKHGSVWREGPLHFASPCNPTWTWLLWHQGLCGFSQWARWLAVILKGGIFRRTIWQVFREVGAPIDLFKDHFCNTQREDGPRNVDFLASLLDFVHCS